MSENKRVSESGCGGFEHEQREPDDEDRAELADLLGADMVRKLLEGGDAELSVDKRVSESVILICQPRTDCVDPHSARWHCMRGHDGAAEGDCPLEACQRQGANEPRGPGGGHGS